MVRFLLLHLWMPVLSLLQLQTRDSLPLQRISQGEYPRGQKYFFDKTIYDNRVFDSKGVADPSVEIQFGPNIKDWPEDAGTCRESGSEGCFRNSRSGNYYRRADPVGETSSYRSNPLGLAEFTLSRKDPAYVGRAKRFRKQSMPLRTANVRWMHCRS